MSPSPCRDTYSIHNVFRCLSPEQREEIKTFWKRNKALPSPEEAESRVDQVVMMVTEPGGDVVGVSTVYPGRLKDDERSYFFYRMFIQPGDRVFGLMTAVTEKTFQFLKESSLRDKPDGLIIVTENPKLMRKGTQKLLNNLGFELIGKNQKKLDVWLGKVKPDSFI